MKGGRQNSWKSSAHICPTHQPLFATPKKTVPNATRLPQQSALLSALYKEHPALTFRRATLRVALQAHSESSGWLPKFWHDLPEEQALWVEVSARRLMAMCRHAGQKIIKARGKHAAWIFGVISGSLAACRNPEAREPHTPAASSQENAQCLASHKREKKKRKQESEKDRAEKETETETDRDRERERERAQLLEYRMQREEANKRERERERERHREREREADPRERERERARKGERVSERVRDRETERQRDRDVREREREREPPETIKDRD